MTAGAGLAFGFAAFAAAFAQPLADPDLGTRLRTGEWIAAHRALPRTELFAWTRAGEPFFAYSWLAEVTYHAAERLGGATGLRLVHALTYAAALASVLLLARVYRLRPLPSALLASGHLLTLWGTTPYLRTQSLMAVAIPLCWAGAVRLASCEREERWPYAALLGGAALAANVHLLAPLCASTLAILLPRLRSAPRRVLLGSGAVLLGLVATPNARDWLAIWRLNFAPNPIYSYPTLIAEYMPGVVAHARGPSVFTLVAVVLLALPWWRPAEAAPVSSGGPGAALERLMLAALWCVGAALFATTAKGLWVWWLVSLPLLAERLVGLPEVRSAPVRRACVVLAALLGVMPGLSNAARQGPTLGREADLVQHALPTPLTRAALALADTLDALAPGGCGRVVTTFNYGNVLLGRLPRYSLSIDGRTIFPDSIARSESLTSADFPVLPVAPIAGADAAILPAGHRFEGELARRPEWHLMARAVVHPVGPLDRDTVATLWGRTDRAAETITLPALPTCDTAPLVRAARSASGSAVPGA